MFHLEMQMRPARGYKRARLLVDDLALALTGLKRLRVKPSLIQHLIHPEHESSYKLDRILWTARRAGVGLVTVRARSAPSAVDHLLVDVARQSERVEGGGVDGALGRAPFASGTTVATRVRKGAVWYDS